VPDAGRVAAAVADAGSADAVVLRGGLAARQIAAEIEKQRKAEPARKTVPQSITIYSEGSESEPAASVRKKKRPRAPAPADAARIPAPPPAQPAPPAEEPPPPPPDQMPARRVLPPGGAPILE
jgi:hypothetical protein